MPVVSGNGQRGTKKQPQQNIGSTADARDCGCKLSWRRKAFVCALSSALLLLLAATASVHASAPSLRPVRVALDASSDVSRLTALVDAEVFDPATAWHTVRLWGGKCAVDTDCGTGTRCTALVAQVSEAFYPEESRAHFVVTTTQVSSQNLQHVFSGGAYDIGITCDLELGVDVFKTGLVVKQGVRWRFDDVASSATPAAAAGEGGLRPLLQVRREGWNMRPGSRREANVSLDGDYIAELTLPQGPLAAALEAVSIGVKANAGYIEAEQGALEGRLLVDSDLRVMRNATTGCTVVSLPFHVDARADLLVLVGYAPKAAVGPLPTAMRGNLQRFLMDHSLVFQALSETQAAAGLLGQAHIIGWRREGKQRFPQAPLSGGRALATAATLPPHARRLLSFFGLEDVVGVELQGLEMHHRLYMDDNDFMGLDVKLVEGPPFAAAMGVRLDSRALDDLLGDSAALFGNATLIVHGVQETASLNISISQYQGQELQLSESLTAELDLKGESLDVTFGLKSGKDLDMTLVAGVHANDSLAFLRIDGGDAGKASLSADLEALKFEATLHTGDTSIDINGIEDQVDFDAKLGDQFRGSLAYRHSDTGADAEDFRFAFALEQLTESWRPDGSSRGDDEAEVLTQATGSVNFTLNQGRRRTASKGGKRELSAHLWVLPTCSSGAPGEAKEACQDCCERTGVGQLVNGLDLEMGQSVATEGFDVIITNVAGSEGDMDFVAAWDMSDEATPRASAMLRVVDGVSTLNFTLGQTARETLRSGAASWHDITEGRVIDASLFDGTGELLRKYGVELHEDSEWRSVKVVEYDGNATLKMSGSGDWKGWAAGFDGEQSLSWIASDAVDNQISRGSAWLEETGAGVIVMEREQVLNSQIFFDKKPEGDIKMFANANLDAAKELVAVSVEWSAASTWGGDLEASFRADEEYAVLAHLSEDEDVRTANLTASHRGRDGDVQLANSTALGEMELVAGLLLAASAGDEANPAFLNATILESEGTELTMLASAYGEITNLDHAFETTDRVIRLAHPINASGMLDLRDEGRVGSWTWIVAKEASGSGDVLTSTAVLATSLDDEDRIRLEVAFDTSAPDKMDVSAQLTSGSSSVVEANGSWPYDGDYMEGDLAVVADDHTQMIHTRASRGFLVQQLKSSGYDAFWLSLGTVIDGERMLNLTDLYLERGPDIAWSGIGWNFRLSELDGQEYVERYSNAFDIDFVPGTPPPIADVVATSFDVAIEMTNLSTFSISDVVASLANASGIAEDDVVVEEIRYDVKAKYSFDTEVTVAQATAAVAVANSVLETQVALVPEETRRLAAAGVHDDGDVRRLAAQAYEVIISTPDAAEASSVLASSADQALLAASLQALAPEAPAPAIDEAPTAQVTVKTALLADAAEGAVEAPSAEALTEQLSEALGQPVAVDMKAETINLCPGGACTEEEGADEQSEGEETVLSGAWRQVGVPPLGVFSVLLAVLAPLTA